MMVVVMMPVLLVFVVVIIVIVVVLLLAGAFDLGIQAALVATLSKSNRPVCRSLSRSMSP